MAKGSRADRLLCSLDRTADPVVFLVVCATLYLHSTGSDILAEDLLQFAVVYTGARGAVRAAAAQARQ